MSSEWYAKTPENILKILVRTHLDGFAQDISIVLPRCHEQRNHHILEMAAQLTLQLLDQVLQEKEKTWTKKKRRQEEIRHVNANIHTSTPHNKLSVSRHSANWSEQLHN